MMPRVYVSAFDSRRVDFADGTGHLKQAVEESSGRRVRRVNPFGLCAVRSLLALRERRPIPPETALYLSTVSGSPGNTRSVLRSIYEEHSPPLPLDFIDTMPNTASFHCAQTLGLRSENMTISQQRGSLAACIELTVTALGTARAEYALAGDVTLEHSETAATTLWLFLSRTADRGALCTVALENERQPARDSSVFREELAAFLTGASRGDIVLPGPSGRRSLVFSK
jgi:hypothetical protein